MEFFNLAESKWNDFLKKKITFYEKYRNYDNGPESENFVSGISQFVTHRVLLEYSIIKDIRFNYKSKNVNKFIEEVYWRIYWKGWLENRPSVWTKFVQKSNNKFDLKMYEKAIQGKTEIPFFNSWVDELKEFNYLHNHTRMWFASTWIFNLGLPWELGARFFLKHLYDGDAASNTLSWRWVAGLHTKGKKYIFTPSNLRKFSNNRFNTNFINNKQIDLIDDYIPDFEDSIYSCNMQKKNNKLILFENDLHISTLQELINKYEDVFLIVLDDKDRQIKISDKVLKFKKILLKEFNSKFSNTKIVNSSNLYKELVNCLNVDVLYPGQGDNLDFLQRLKTQKDSVFNYLVREEDLYSWKFAKKGFFKFKENIPKINNFLGSGKY
tara:strand:- start:161 stop:1303 length:1143 start_codon:yes stop_codon:yes gene_type:complete